MSDIDGARVCSLCQSAVPEGKKMYRLDSGKVGCEKCFELQEIHSGSLADVNFVRQAIQAVLILVGVICCIGFLFVVRNAAELALGFALGSVFCFALAVIIQLLHRIVLAVERMAPRDRE